MDVPRTKRKHFKNSGRILAAVSSYLPARKAAKVEPMVALRYE